MELHAIKLNQHFNGYLRNKKRYENFLEYSLLIAVIWITSCLKFIALVEYSSLFRVAEYLSLFCVLQIFICFLDYVRKTISASWFMFFWCSNQLERSQMYKVSWKQFVESVWVAHNISYETIETMEISYVSYRKKMKNDKYTQFISKSLRAFRNHFGFGRFALMLLIFT